VHNNAGDKARRVHKRRGLHTKIYLPGGHVPTVTQPVESINKGSQGRLIVDQIENIGPHYSKMLRLRKEKLMMNFDAGIQPALVSEHSGMTESDVRLFRREREVLLKSLASPSIPAFDDVLLVLFHVLRSRLQHQNS
jgi:cyclopropane-fatty-acyl-phospholipid synthase